MGKQKQKKKRKKKKKKKKSSEMMLDCMIDPLGGWAFGGWGSWKGGASDSGGVLNFVDRITFFFFCFCFCFGES